MFTGAALDGVPQDVNDDEVAPHPDLDHPIIMPFNREIAWFPGDLWIGDTPFDACSRQILKRVTADAAALGYTFNLGIETEFFLLTDTDKPAPASPDDNLDKPCYDLRTMLHNYPVVDEIVSAMNELGWDVYSFDHEDGNGQFETDFTYTNVVSMADRLVFFRMMVGEIARKHGLFASWMPKPFADRTGSGAHYNMSLADGSGTNLFAAEDDPRGCGLSTLGYQFIAGVLRHAHAICAVIAPTVNSYKRLVKQGSMSGLTWAPGVRLLRRQQPHEHAAHPEGRRAGRVPRRRQRQQPLPRWRAHAGRRAGGHPRGTRSWRAEPGQPLPAHRGRPRRRVESVGCHGHWARRSMHSRRIRWCGRCSVTRCSSRSSPRSAPSGTVTTRTCRHGRPNAT